MSEFSDGLAVGMNSNNNCYPCVPAYGYGGYGGNGMNGWGDGWWILLLLLCGWGNNGWGNNGGFGGGNFAGYEIGKLATTNDVASGFNNSAVLNNLNDLKLGQQDGFSAVQQTLCQGFSGVNATVNQVGNNINQGICNLGYNMQAGFNQLGHQISDCCCQTQRAIDGINFNAERNTRDIIDSQRCGTDRIINFLTNQELDRLRTENQTLRFEKSQANQNAFITANQEAQTAELIRRLGRDCPVPAYVVPNPNCCYDGVFGRAGWNNGGCCDSCC